MKGIAPSLVTFVAASSMLVSAASAADKAAAVEERQDLMEEIGKNFKVIAEWVKEDKHSREEAAESAGKIHELSADVTKVFEVRATLEEMDEVGKNRGEPEIWDEWEDFETATEKLQEESGKLVAVFDGDADKTAVTKQFAATGKQACGNCHDRFRGPEVE